MTTMVIVVKLKGALRVPHPHANPRRRPARATTGEAAPRIAVLVPCFNEEPPIANVVRDFRAALPTACVYVHNNSTDRTAEVARSAGAVVRRDRMQGKGNVVRREHPPAFRSKATPTRNGPAGH
jgi:hypothetical protein